MEMRYPLLDPLRGLAALWVFVFHYRFSDQFQSAVPWIHQWLKFGDRGVPIFFVISGYCLTASALSSMKRSEAPNRVLFRRAKRIYTTFWCSVILIVLTHLLFLEFWQLARGDAPGMLANRFAKYDAFDWIKIVSLTQIFDRDFGIWFGRFGSINGAYWTLAIELQFYLVMAVGLIRPRLFYPVLATVTLLSIPAYCYRWMFVKLAGYGLFLPYWSWFALGILLCESLRRGVTPRRVFGRYTTPATLTLLSLMSTTIVILVLRGGLQDRLLFAIVFTGMLWLAHPWGSRQAQQSSHQVGLLSRSLTLLGAMSYSLYLVHNQISKVLRGVGEVWIDRGIVLDLSVIVGTCLLCYPFYRFCEAPFVAGASRTRAVVPVMRKLETRPLQSSEGKREPSLRRAA